MRKTIGLIFAAFLIVAGFSTNSFAQRKYNHNVNQRESRQQRRIYQGVRSGSLNRREAYRLERQQVNLRRTEARYRRSGGGLSWRERRNLEHRLNRSSRSIYNQKHDRQHHGYIRRRL